MPGTTCAARPASSPSCDGHQGSHPYQIVGGGREEELPVHALAAPMFELPHPADRLHPAEDFFNALTDALAHGVPGVARRASIERAAPRVLRDVRRGPQRAHHRDKRAGVVPLVAADRLPPRRQVRDQARGRVAFADTRRRHDTGIDDGGGNKLPPIRPERTAMAPRSR